MYKKSVDIELSNLILPIAVATAAGILGGVISLFWNESDRWRSYLLHFAAGLLTAIIAVDLLPQARQDGEPIQIIIAFFLGALLMIAVRILTEKLEKKAEDRGNGGKPFGLAIPAAIDTVVDGFIIGAGFTADPTLGWVLAIVLGLELFVLLLSVSTVYQNQGVKRATTVLTTTFIAITLPVGAISGFLILGEQPVQVIANVLAFAAAALLYLDTDQLLVKGKEARDSTSSVAFFFMGFLVLMAFTLLME
jgi:zinc transporter, ZIP family